MNDLIELEKKLLEVRSISKLDIRRELEENFNMDNTSEFESQVNDDFKKYKLLAKLFGTNVFQYSENELVIEVNPQFKSKPEYLLCLYCMEKSDKKEKEIGLFEKIVAEALQQYLGQGSEYRLIDRKKESIDIEKFCREELQERPHSGAQKTFKNPANTLRCDVIVWKKVDNRVGKIVCLVQCKSGKNWRDGHPVNIEGCKKVINLAVAPLRVFAISDLLNEDELFSRSSEKGLILDRVRIISLLANVEHDSIKQVRQEIQELGLEKQIF